MQRIGGEETRTNRDEEKRGIEDDEEGDESLEVNVLSDIVDESPEAATLGPRRQMQRLRNLQSLL